MKRRLLKNPQIREKYVEQMQVAIDMGHVEKVPEIEIHTDDQVWNIPHHCVVNDKRADKLLCGI